MGARGLLLLAPVAVGVGSVAVALTPGLAPPLAALGLVVFGISIANPTINSLISQRAASTDRGMVLGVAQSAASLARVFGPAWAGFCFVAFGRDWPFLSGGLIMVVMGGLALRLFFALAAAGREERPGD